MDAAGAVQAQPRAAHWVFTINNPNADDREQLEILAASETCKGMIFQKEVGENGTPHYQGYVALAKRLRRAQLSKHLPRAWLDVCRSPKDAIEYCRKGETRVEGPWEFGELEIVTKGKRNDINKVHDLLRSGKFTADDIHEEHFAIVLKYGPSLQSAVNHYVPDRNHRTQLHILYGRPGTGKTFMAMHMYDPPLDGEDPPPNPRTFKMNVNRTDPWFDGYDPMLHDFVVFDEYKGSIDHDKILQLIDEYPTMVERKGGFVKWRPKHVVMTMNAAPYLLYKKTWAKTRDSYDAFWRRVTTLTHVKGFDPELWVSKVPLEYAERNYHKAVAHVDAEDRRYRAVQPTHQPEIQSRPTRAKKRAAPERDVDKRQRTIDDYIE